jgi:acetyltransferase-like isoleucine patch superfamily enzyme
MRKRLLAPILRRFNQFIHAINSKTRIITIKILYPDVYFGKNVYLDEGVRIKAIDGGSVHIGEAVYLDRNTTIAAKQGKIMIGPRSYVGENVIIVAVNNIRLGTNSLIAQGVTIRDQQHGTEIGTVPFEEQPLRTAPVFIGNNVWIGAKATILKGVTIGDSTVIGANALVNRSFPTGTVAVGVPARVIKTLGNGL